jgi:hypothetical protein
VRCHHTDEPRTVLAVILVGVPLRGVTNDPPPAKGGGSSRPKVTRLVRYGPVRQKKNFSRSCVVTRGLFASKRERATQSLKHSLTLPRIVAHRMIVAALIKIIKILPRGCFGARRLGCANARKLVRPAVRVSQCRGVGPWLYRVSFATRLPPPWPP